MFLISFGKFFLVTNYFHCCVKGSFYGAVFIEPFDAII